ncbi:MAG TPA: NADH-quinone oxidoreductase subunit H, partial [Acidocella sp.]|nr:NADH-quinone oxidoreductase subunit H [Acidocella sp.]
LVIVALAETGRFPVDNPATHLELTMIHEAMILEYSGRHLALIELASALRLLLYMSLIVSIFVPFGIAPAGALAGALGLGIALYLLKLTACTVLLAVFETATAKMRIFRVPNFVGAALMLGLLATLLMFVSATL